MWSVYSDARIVAIALVLCSFVLCLFLWLQLRRAYAVRSRRCQRRRIYSLITLMPLVVITGAVVGVFLPMSFPLFEWAIKAFEAVAIYKFADLIVLICGGREAMLTDLAGIPMRKYWAVPPCGCCLGPCMSKQVFTERDHRHIRGLLLQFVVAAPLLFLVLLVCFVADVDNRVRLVINGLAGISAMLCFYGLSTLFFAVRQLPGMRESNVVSKFLVIKLVVILSTLQTLIIDSAVEAGEFDEGYEENEPRDVGNIVKCMLIALEAPLVAYLAGHAYPASELEADEEEAFATAPLLLGDSTYDF